MKDYYNNLLNENKACMKRSKLGDIYKKKLITEKEIKI